MNSSRPDTAATNRDVDSLENRNKFIIAKEATTYDNLLLDGRISNANVRSGAGLSGLHCIPYIGSSNKNIDTDILLSYLLTCDPPADVNGRDTDGGCTPMWQAASWNSISAVKVLIDFAAIAQSRITAILVTIPTRHRSMLLSKRIIILSKRIIKE